MKNHEVQEACARIVEAPHWKVVVRNELQSRASAIRALKFEEVSAEPVVGEYFCEKCGYLGDNTIHDRPGTPYRCDYMARETVRETSPQVSAEPVAYFQVTGDHQGYKHYEQVAQKYRNDKDVFPLYTRPQPCPRCAELQEDPRYSRTAAKETNETLCAKIAALEAENKRLIALDQERFALHTLDINKNIALEAELTFQRNAHNQAQVALFETRAKIAALETKCAELEQEVSDWRNNLYTSLWKQRAENRDKTIESQRLILMDLRGQVAALEAEIERKMAAGQVVLDQLSALEAELAHEKSKSSSVFYDLYQESKATIAQQAERIKELENQCRTNHSMEIDALARKCDEQAAQLTAAEKDVQRIDWLETQGMIGIDHYRHGDYRHYAGGAFMPIREAIDAAIAGWKK